MIIISQKKWFVMIWFRCPTLYIGYKFSYGWKMNKNDARTWSIHLGITQHLNWLLPPASNRFQTIPICRLTIRPIAYLLNIRTVWLYPWSNTRNSSELQIIYKRGAQDSNLFFLSQFIVARLNRREIAVMHISYRNGSGSRPACSRRRRLDSPVATLFWYSVDAERA